METTFQVGDTVRRMADQRFTRSSQLESRMTDGTPVVIADMNHEYLAFECEGPGTAPGWAIEYYELVTRPGNTSDDTALAMALELATLIERDAFVGDWDENDLHESAWLRTEVRNALLERA